MSIISSGTDDGRGRERTHGDVCVCGHEHVGHQAAEPGYSDVLADDERELRRGRRRLACAYVPVSGYGGVAYP